MSTDHITLTEAFELMAHEAVSDGEIARGFTYNGYVYFTNNNLSLMYPRLDYMQEVMVTLVEILVGLRGTADESNALLRILDRHADKSETSKFETNEAWKKSVELLKVLDNNLPLDEPLRKTHFTAEQQAVQNNGKLLGHRSSTLGMIRSHNMSARAMERRAAKEENRPERETFSSEARPLPTHRFFTKTLE